MSLLIGDGRFQFNKEGGIRILKVLGWTVLSLAIAALLDAIKMIDVPTQYLFVIPIINTLLVALQEFIRKSTPTV